MMTKISYGSYRFPHEIIQQAIWLYVRFTLSFRDVEDLRRRRRGRGPRCAGPDEKEQARRAETHAQAFEEIWLCPRQAHHRRAEILCCCSRSSWDRKTP